jgi:hypothetical protein
MILNPAAGTGEVFLTGSSMDHNAKEGRWPLNLQTVVQ